MLSAIVLVIVSAVMAEPVSSGAFPGTNAKIAFWSDRDGNYEIYVMDADGSNQTNLTNSNDLYERFPSWSPDGTKIIFTSAGVRLVFGGADPNGDIFVMDADGSNRTNLTNDVDAYKYPSWSPDSSKIVFVKSSEIWVMNSDGSNQTQISNPTQITILPLPGLRTARKSFSLRRAMVQQGTTISS